MSTKLEESELARKEQRQELTDVYDYCEMIQDINSDLVKENMRLSLLVSSLNKRIKRGELQ